VGANVDVITLVAGGLLLIALITIVAVIHRRSVIIRELRDSAGFLSGIQGDGVRSNGLVRAVREHVVTVEDQSFGGRIVLSRPLPALRQEYAEDEVAHHWSFWLGSLLTGIALIATFFLIAWVMTHEVSGAIRESSGADDTASTKHLSQAVQLLGGKFFISAAGVGGSVLALFAGNWARAGIYRHAEHPPADVMAAFTSVEAHQLNLKLAEQEALRIEREREAAQHAEVCAHLATLNTRIEKLNSIEVSVKTIGNEVSANLKNIMKDAMGEQLKGMLADTMAEVAGIAASVQQNLTDSFGLQLKQLTTELQRSLTALQGAIEGQAQGQLEKILGQLQNAVSGGFQSESQKMVAALEGFARVVPALEQQLRAMTGTVAEETRQRSEEAARLNQALMDRVGSLLETMSAQQAANAQAIERIQAVSEQGAETIARKLESSGAGLVNNVLGASRVEIQAIVEQLRAAADASSSRYSHIETQASNAAGAVAQATEGLMRSANAIIDVANQASALVGQAKAGGEAMHAASRDFVQAGNAVLGWVRQMQGVVDATKAQTTEQQQLLLRQREYTKEVEKLWPQLFNTYLAQFKASADELGRSWESFYQKISAVSNSVGDVFAENTAVLAETVDRLVKHNAGNRVA
jgi:hypothetical protein